MARWSHGPRTVFAKLVYYGPALGGKTTNLEQLHRITDPDGTTRLLSVKTADDRTLFFDLLPFDLGEISGYKVAVKLYTVPGQVRYDTTRRVVLSGADAVVFVADSCREREAENRASLDNLRVNLRKNRIDPASLPVFFQFNKQDLPDAALPEEVARWLGADASAGVAAVASRGMGVLETFVGATVEMLMRLASAAGPRAGAALDPEEVRRQIDRVFGPLLKSLPSRGAPAGGPGEGRGNLPIVPLGEDLLDQSVRVSVEIGEHLAAQTVRTERLEREAEALRRLSDSLRGVGASFDPDAIADAALAAVGTVLGTSRVTLAAISGARGVVAERGFGPGAEPLLRSAPGLSLARALLSLGAERLVEDVSVVIGPEAAGTLRSVAVAPVPSETPRAIFAYANERDRFFDAADLRFLSTVAGHLSVGLDKARLHAELARHRDRLEAVVESRTRALRRAYAELRDLDRMKDRFLSNLSHEMRTPVASILGAATFLRDYEGSAEERSEMIDSVIRASNALDGLIENLLRVARLEEKSETLSLSLVDPRDVAVRAVAISGHACVTVEAEEGLEPLALDADRICRAIANLIDNALKFSPPGSPVTVRASATRLRKAPETLGAVAFSVLDRGPGPDPAESERLFGPFEQGGDPLTGKPKGVGLGLHEARQVAKMHGGVLRWRRRSGGGSEMRLLIPRRSVAGRKALLA